MSNRYKVLFIDSKSALLRSFKSIFSCQYEVHGATNSKDALDIIKKQAIEVVVCDDSFPGGNDRPLYRAIQSQHSRVKLLLLSNQPRSLESSEANNDSLFPISKPLVLDQLKKALSLAARAARSSKLAANSEALKSMPVENHKIFCPQSATEAGFAHP